MMSSFYDEIVFFFKIRFLRVKNEIKLEFEVNWLWYVVYSSVLVLSLTPVMVDVSFIMLHVFIMFINSNYQIFENVPI